MKHFHKPIAVLTSLLLVAGAWTWTVPISAEAEDVNLLQNPGFEETDGTWVDFEGNPMQTQVHSGSRALRVTENIKYNDWIPIEAGRDYVLGAWVYGNVEIQTAVQAAGGGLDYRNVVTGGTDGTWTWIEGTVHADSAGSLNIMFIYKGATAWVDDVSVKQVPVEPANLLANPGFEEPDGSGWIRFGDVPITTSDAVVCSGSASLVLTGGVKTTAWIPVQEGDTFQAEAWVCGNVQLQSAQMDGSGGVNYAMIASGGTDGEWTRITGSMTIGPGITQVDVTLLPGAGSAYVDDVSLIRGDGTTEEPQNLVRNPSFEDADTTWVNFSGVPAAIPAHGGSKSLILTENAKYYDWVPVTEGKSYTVGAWVYGSVEIQSVLLYDAGGDPAYLSVANGGAEGTWTWLEGTVNVDAPAKLNIMFLYKGATAYVDDAVIQLQDSGEEPGEEEEEDPNNLAKDPGFEKNDGSWILLSGDPITVTEDPVHGGSQALELTESAGVKCSEWIAAKAGDTFTVGAWVYGAVKIQSAQLLGGNVNYVDVASGGTAGTWTWIEGTIPIGAEPLSMDITLLSAGGTAYVDDVKVTCTPAEEPDEEEPGEEEPGEEPGSEEDPDNLAEDPGFEKNDGSWVQLDGSPIEVSDSIVHDGTYSLELTAGVKCSKWISALAGDTFTVGAWVYGPVQIQSAQLLNGNVNYVEVASGGTAGTWTWIEGTIPIGAEPLKLDVTFLPVAGTAYVDGVSVEVTRAAAEGNNLLENPGFEEEETGWICFGDTPIVTTDRIVYDGEKALELTGGVKTSAWIPVTNGDSYRLSAWVYGPVRLQSAQMDGSGNVNYIEIAAGGTAGEWTLLEGGFSIGAGLKQIDITLLSDSGTAYVDNVVLIRTKDGSQTAPVPSAGTHRWVYSTCGEGGTLYPSDGDWIIPDGSTFTFEIRPDEGYGIADVCVDDVSVGPVTTYVFHELSGNHTIDVSFVYLYPEEKLETESGEVNLLENPGFEASGAGWVTFDGSPFAVSTEITHGGNRALTLTGGVKCSDWIPVHKGDSYRVGAWVYGRASLISAQLGIDGSISYVTIAEGGQDGAWTQLEGLLEISDGNTTHIDVTFTPAEGTTAYVDDVTLYAAGSAEAGDVQNILQNAGFEAEDGSGWICFGDAPIETASLAHGGERSLLLTGGVKCSEWIEVHQGDAYTVSAWVYGKVQLQSALLGADGSINYALIAEGGRDGEWTRLEGVLAIDDASITHVDVTFLPTAGTAYVDDASAVLRG